MPLSNNLRGAFAMSIAMAAFTVNDALVKAATQTLPLFEVIALRGLVSVPMLLLYGWAVGGLRFRLSRPDRRVLALRAGADVLATITYLSALMVLPLANLVAILQSVPLAVTLAAALYLREPLGWGRMGIILAGFGGVLLIVRPGAEGFSLWSLLGLASVFCIVLRDLLTRKLSSEVPSATAALWTSASVAVMGCAGLLLIGPVPFGLVEALELVGAAVGLIVGYLFIVAGMRVGDIAVVQPFRYTALIWAIAVGWLLFGALPDGMTLAGSALVAVTGIVTLWREATAPRSVREPSVDIPRDSPYSPRT